MSPLRVLTVVGARPQFIKASAVSRAAAAGGEIDEILVHTGQHYDPSMSDSFFHELEIPAPAHHLGVGSGPHGEQTGRMLELLEPVIDAESPDIVMVYGDTNSTLAAAIVAAKMCVPIAHVEAGLRSFRPDMPEEVNRRLTDHVSSLLFCPSPGAVDLLAKEGITEGVHLSGDVMYDVLLHHGHRAGDEILADLGLEPASYAVATVHRAENTNDRRRLHDVLTGLRGIAEAGIEIVLPVHPRVRDLLPASLPGIRTIPAQPYGAMVALVRSARLVLTDSGGLQKEAFWLRVPTVTLRDETEWPETVQTGWSVLAGSDPARITALGLAARPPADLPEPYGPPGAAERIVSSLVRWHDTSKLSMKGVR